jgi:hypothetical protein
MTARCSVSETSIPIQLSGNYIYRIGYGLPFFNMSSALRTIIFGVRNHIARTCGILLGWVALSCVAPVSRCPSLLDVRRLIISRMRPQTHHHPSHHVGHATEGRQTRGGRPGCRLDCRLGKARLSGQGLAPLYPILNIYVI